MLIYYGQKPNELMVKRVAMIGCSALVLVHSLKENKKLRSYAGVHPHGPPSRGGGGPEALHFSRALHPLLGAAPGMLLADENDKQHSVKRSIALLLGRIMMSFLFIYVGITQLKRVMLRDMALWNEGCPPTTVCAFLPRPQWEDLFMPRHRSLFTPSEWSGACSSPRGNRGRP